MFRGHATAGGLLRAERNPAGFDYLRLALAFAVLAFHCIVITQGRAGEDIVWASHWRPLAAAFVPMFFAMSGYLVTASVLRSSIAQFVVNRAVRLLPALATQVVISALLLGLCVTTLPVTEYLSSPDLWRYLRTAIGWTQFKAPGVFTGNPTHELNLSLWTIPYELLCYLALGGATVIGLVQRSRLFVAVLLALHIALFLWDALRIGVIGVQDDLPPRVLALVYMSGVAMYVWRDQMLLSTGRMVLATGLTWACLTFPIGIYFVALPVAYLTVCVGLLNPPRHWIIKSGSYSYGVYLYAFPIQQTSVYLWPSLGPIEVFLIAAPLSALAATFSWHVIEKPCLALRHALIGKPRVAAAA